MAGIYIHIPFCKTRCSYCDFFSTTNESTADRYVDAVNAELVFRKNELKSSAISTIYFGGGTPSQLSIAQFELIFSTIYSNFEVEEEAEITIEANPDDMTEEYVEGLKTLPFNRVSMGIQSFDDGDLKRLNRRHTAQQALDVVERCKRSGLNNISIDLMYGLPLQTFDGWKRNVAVACSLGVQHISAYHLIYEKGTKLFQKLKKGEVVEADEELSVSMFQYLRESLISHGFIHYEISNFGLEGLFSKHNSSYWKGVPYLGIGASAHSFDGENRWWNAPNMKSYLQQGENGLFLPEIEKGTHVSRYNDYVIVSLRTMWGLDIEELGNKFGDFYANYFLKEVGGFIDKGWVVRQGNSYSITPEGLFVSDTILVALICLEDD